MPRTDLDEIWNELEELGVQHQTLQYFTNHLGYNLETFEAILYQHTGYRSFDQLEEG